MLVIIWGGGGVFNTYVVTLATGDGWTVGIMVRAVFVVGVYSGSWGG